MTDEEDPDDEDDEMPEEDLEDKLSRLYDTRNDLYINLKAVDMSLAELGYQVDTQVVKAAKGQPQTGIRIKGKLSFRGRQMAKEYFYVLDDDRDGYLAWGDLRAMRSLAEGAANSLGLLLEPEYQHWESWKMYMDDAGIKTDKCGRLGVYEFVRYRELIEMRQPLARELSLAGIGYLPALLKQWALLKVLIAEVLAVRSEARSRDERGLGYDEIQFVLCNAGIVFTRPEFFNQMLDRAAKEKTMEALLLRHLKRRYAGSPTKYAQILAQGVIPSKALHVEIDDIKYTKPSQLLAWLFTERLEPRLKKGIYRSLIIVKYQAFRAIRYIDQVTRTMFNMAGQFRLRKVFDDFIPILKLLPKENEKMETYLEVDVLGQGGNIDEGMGVEWGMNKLDDTEQYLMRQRLPRDAGLAIFVDFMLRSETKPNNIRDSVQSLNNFIKHHFDAELKKNVQFRGIYVLSTVSEGDGAKVLRIAVCYKRIVSLDAHFEQMLIPYCLTDLIGACTGSFKTSASFSDIMNPSNVFQLDTAFTARFESIFSYRKHIVLGLVHRLYLSLSAGYTEHQVRPDSEDANEIMRRKLRAYFPWMMSTASYAESWIRGHKSVSATFEFKALSELLSRLGKVHPWFKSWLPESIGSAPGWINGTYQTFCKGISRDLKEIYDKFRTSLEERAVREEVARKARVMQLMTEMKRDAEADAKSNVLDKLKRLGIEIDVDDVFAVDANDPKSFVTTAEDRLFRNDLQFMKMLETLHETVLGLHTVQVVLGKARLNFAFQGVDFVEALPKPPPTSKMHKEMEERRVTAMQK